MLHSFLCEEGPDVIQWRDPRGQRLCHSRLGRVKAVKVKLD